MQLTTYAIVFGVIGLVSLALNLFQLYRDRINRQRSRDERRLHETILRGLWQSMTESARSLEQLRRKGADGTTVADIIGGVVNAQRIEIEEFLKCYYSVGTKQLAPSLTRAVVTNDGTEVRARSLELVEGVEAITSTMIEAVENAEGYIFSVGGRSRNNRYLAALRQRVFRGDVRYVRVITGDHIRHQLHEHIHDVFKFVELGYLKEDKYGGILVTRDTVILAIYSSSVPTLDKGLKMAGEQIASDYRSIVQDLFNASEKPITMDFVSGLCTTCREKSHKG